jgi:CRISPR/Cas system-associated protein Csm6
LNDLLARTGGEEFTILLPQTSSATGMVAAERVRQSIEELEVVFEHEPIKITVSVGLAQLDPVLHGWESMMRRADTAMYRAKAQGRNQAVGELGSILPERDNFSREATLAGAPLVPPINGGSPDSDSAGPPSPFITLLGTTRPHT